MPPFAQEKNNWEIERLAYTDAAFPTTTYHLTEVKMTAFDADAIVIVVTDDGSKLKSARDFLLRTYLEHIWKIQDLLKLSGLSEN